MALLAESPLADPLAPAMCRVVEKRRELPDTVTLDIETPDGFQFAPGQFTMLYVFGVGEVPISISGDPTATGRIVHTIRAVGPVTDALCGLEPGDEVGVRGPYGTPWPVEAAAGHDIVFVSGGIGLAPLRPAIYYVLANREQYGDVVILYGARAPEEMLYARELREWGGRFDATVLVTVDRAARGWTGSVGVVTKLINRGPYDGPEAVGFVCGPEIMMRFSAEGLVKAGVSPERVYLSMERNMHCAIAACGHCQFGQYFVCEDGPVFRFDMIEPLMAVKEV